MFRALNQKTGQDIISIDPAWRRREKQLRQLGTDDILICPGCKQPVRLRTGVVRRWHFAHKHLENCPLGRESLITLAVRAALYEWLVLNFGSQRVTLEHPLIETPLPRPVDCWVEAETGAFAYWVFDKGKTPSIRQSVRDGFTQVGILPQYIFASTMLRTEPVYPNRLHTTTTERDFMSESIYNQAWTRNFQNIGMSLHYLNPSEKTLMTFRDLVLVHKPQLYQGVRMRHLLSEISPSPENGEFIHPGEHAKLQARERQIATKRLESARRLQSLEDFLSRRGGKTETEEGGSSKPTEVPIKRRQPFAREGVCRICGTITNDWVTYFGATGECLCRHC
jgi:hypothetical protein